MSDEKKATEAKKGPPGYTRVVKDVPCGDDQLKAKQAKLRAAKDKAAAAGNNGRK